MPYKSLYPDVPPTPDVNIHHLLFNRPDQAEWSKLTFLVDAKTGKRRTYGQFYDRLRLAITALGAPTSQGGLGLRREDGDLVGIISQNAMDYITLLHACLATAIPFSLISPYATPFELTHALEVSKVTRLFVNARLLPVVLPIAKELGIPSNKVYALGGKAKGRKSLSELIKHVQTQKVPVVEPRPVKKDTLAYLIFSSGTSGLPKAVMISHGNLYCCMNQFLVVAQDVAEVYTPPPFKTPEGIPVTLAFLPLHHSYGLHSYALRTFLSPTTNVILPQWNTKLALELIPKYRVTSFTLIPSIIHQLANYPNIEKYDLSSLRSMGSGAAYLPVELEARMKSLAPKDCIWTEGYGLSESTVAIMMQTLPGSLKGRGKIIPRTCGVLLPGMEARIVRDDGTDADVGEVGELYVRGGNVALGYWNNEKATKETFVDGWLHTGDRLYTNGEGYFFYVDRMKDTLKISGMQVSPMEIENVLRAEPQKLIIDVTVAGVSGERMSDEKVPRAWIVLSPAGKKLGVSKTIEALETWHQNNLSKYKWLRGGIEVVNEIPKLPTGKVLRRTLQDKYEQRASKARSKL